MAQLDPTEALAQAQRLGARTQRSARWLARYYVIFGIASMLRERAWLEQYAALGFGLLRGRTWALVLTGVWLVLVLGISLYSSRQQTMVRGGGRIHAGVMAAWTVIWVITVTVGASNDLPWPWWLAGGVGMLASPLVGAWVVLRRTEAAQ